MINASKLILMLILACSSLLATVHAAGPHYKTAQSALIQEVNSKTRTITIRNYQYKLRMGAKVHDSIDKKLPSIRSLKAGQNVKFTTRVNKKNRQVEINEIWIDYP